MGNEKKGQENAGIDQEIKNLLQDDNAPKPKLYIYYGSAEDYKTDDVLILRCFKPNTQFGVPAYVYRGLTSGQLVPATVSKTPEYKAYRNSGEYKQSVDRLVKSVQFAMWVHGPLMVMLQNTNVQSIGIEYGEIAGRFLIGALEEILGNRVKVITMGFPRTWSWELPNTAKKAPTKAASQPGKPVKDIDSEVAKLHAHFKGEDTPAKADPNPVKKSPKAAPSKSVKEEKPAPAPVEEAVQDVAPAIEVTETPVVEATPAVKPKPRAPRAKKSATAAPVAAAE